MPRRARRERPSAGPGWEEVAAALRAKQRECTVWYDAHGWLEARVKQLFKPGDKKLGAVLLVETKELVGGSREEEIDLPSDTVSLGPAFPLDPPDSVQPPPSERDERDVVCLKPDRPAAALPRVARYGEELAVRPAPGAGLGVFAAAPLPAGTAVARYAGALVNKLHYRHGAHMRGNSAAAAQCPDLNTGSHNKVVPGTDDVIDAFQLGRHAAELKAVPPDDPWVARGLGGLINSSRPDRQPNAHFLWFGHACWAVTTTDVSPGQEILIDYMWK